MISVHIEKSPESDLPFYLEMATGDAGTMYSTESINSISLTDWDDADLVGITAAAAASGTVILVRISGGTIDTSYEIKAAVTTSPNAYVDEVFLKLYVREPTN